MRKFFGFIFLIIGICCIGLGVAALSDLSARERSFEGQVQNEFSENYASQNNEQQGVGTMFLIVGVLFCIIGIVLVSSKSKRQKKKEIELEVLKSNQLNTVNNLSIQNPNDLINQLERLWKLKENGILSEDELIEQKKKLLI